MNISGFSYVIIGRSNLKTSLGLQEIVKDSFSMYCDILEAKQCFDGENNC